MHEKTELLRSLGSTIWALIFYRKTPLHISAILKITTSEIWHWLPNSSGCFVSALCMQEITECFPLSSIFKYPKKELLRR